MILLLIIAIIFQFQIINTVTLGDLSLLIFNISYLLKFKKIPTHIFKNNKSLIFFVLWLALSIVFVESIDEKIYLNRLIRILIIIPSYFFIKSFFIIVKKNLINL